MVFAREDPARIGVHKEIKGRDLSHTGQSNGKKTIEGVEDS